MNIIPPVISIDGTSCSGKGMLSKKIAKILKWNILDSGAIYRSLVMLVLKNKIDIKNRNKIVSLANDLNIRFFFEKDKLQVILKEKNISKEIYTEEIASIASKIAIFPCIRNILTKKQRLFRKLPGLIADGRDMGTIVFPDASIKIFIDASLKERASRRMKQLKKMGFNADLNKIIFSMKKRDNRDRNRKISPLVSPNRALVIDSTYLSVKEVVDTTLKYISCVLNV